MARFALMTSRNCVLRGSGTTKDWTRALSPPPLPAPANKAVYAMTVRWVVS